ncbi:MAG: tyrosine-type recombinase/integrase [Bacteroidales bacterium]
MATIKILLKVNKKDINGEMPLYLRIIKNRKPKFISLGIKLKEKDWNPINSTVKKSHPNSARLNNFIAHKMAEAQGITLEMETQSNYVESKSIKEKLTSKDVMNFFEYVDYFKTKVKGTYSEGTMIKFESVMAKLKAYNKKADFTFNDLTPIFLNKYETHLRDELSNSTNTIHANVKIIRRIVNEAIKDDVIPYEKNPFLKYSIKSEKTKIDFLTEKELLSMERIPLQQGSMKYHHRNMYIFATYAGGLRISDLLTLKWSNFDGERILLDTQKTNSTVSIKLPNKALEIINSYKNPDTKKTDFVFPFLKNDFDYSDPKILYKAISAASAYTNRDLKDFAVIMGINKSLHFHTSRHTFATRALRKGARIEYVSKLLGHANIKTTQIYAKIVNEDLDTAMELFN